MAKTYCAAVCRFARGILATLLVACGSSPSSVYKDDSGITGLDFKGSGKVVMVEFGHPRETRSYVVKGDRVLIDMGNGDLEFRNEKDRMHGPFGVTLNPVK